MEGHGPLTQLSCPAMTTTQSYVSHEHTPCPYLLARSLPSTAGEYWPSTSPPLPSLHQSAGGGPVEGHGPLTQRSYSAMTTT